MYLTRQLLLALILLPSIALANLPHGLVKPSQTLRSGIELLTGYLDNNPRANPAKTQEFLESHIAPLFDFKRMSRLVAGPLQRRLNPQQSQRLEQLLKARFISAMSEQLGNYRGARIEYLRPHGNHRRGNVTLGVRLYSRHQPPVQVDFRLSRNRDGWKVYDVLANRFSAVKYYRQEFNGIAKRHGVKELLRRLR